MDAIRDDGGRYNDGLVETTTKAVEAPMHRYPVVYEGSDAEGWSAYLPDLPGCVAVGRTMTECSHAIRDAVALHLDGLAEDGIDPPHVSVPGGPPIP